jgi:ATP phosphoribosyltransferase
MALESKPPFEIREPQVNDDNLRIGVPSKGRMAEQVEELMSLAGLRFRRLERSLFARVSDMPIEITYLRTQDIPVLCAEGAIDMGITGGDLVEESGAPIDLRLRLDIGKCRLAVCAPESLKAASVKEIPQCRVATSFPRITEMHWKKNGGAPHLVNLSGSVEIMIALGVADAIVDLVETGSTLAANHLKILEEIGRYEAVVIQNRQRRHDALADRIIRRLEGVVIARGYSLLEYNIPRSKLAEAEKITPGFKSPTVNPLEDKDWCAIRVMVKRKEVIDVMEKLEAIGASAILETPISNCRL